MGSRGRPSAIRDDPKQLIADRIIFSGKEGISKKDLLQRVYPLDQSTVYRITKDLEREGSIKIIRSGQRTKYIPISSSRRNVAIGAFLIGRSFVGDYSLLGNQGVILCNHVQTYPSYIDFSTYRQFFEPKFLRESALEKTIFEFSNQIGAFITYIFVQAMNVDNINKLQLLKRQKRERKNGKEIIQKENQSRFTTEEWLKNSISSNLVHMLWRFNRMVKPFVPIPDTQTREGIDKRKKLGPYLLEKKAITKLSKAFNNIYPYLNHELENLRTGLPVRIVAYDGFQREVMEKFEKQKKCAHVLSKIHMSERDDRGRKIIVKTCIKCGYQDGHEEQDCPL